MIYFDSAATSYYRPESVALAVAEAIRHNIRSEGKAWNYVWMRAFSDRIYIQCDGEPEHCPRRTAPAR